jgi:hypothetical protein
MQTLTATLVADGSSDRVLLPILEFLLNEHSPLPFRTVFALGANRGPLAQRLSEAVADYPCDLLFVHRDAEAAPIAEREQEIAQATAALQSAPHTVSVIPIRMTESWLLTDAAAIRAAVGNPLGKQALGLPAIARIESLPDPKSVLFSALVRAKGLGARRRASLRPEALRHRVSELIEDHAVLRQLTSFQHLEHQVQNYFRSVNKVKPC